MKIQKKNWMNKQARMCYLQILILILSMFAFSYLIYSSVGSVDASTGDDLDDIIEDFACCEKTKAPNAYSCQYVHEDNCDEDFKKSNTECIETSFCELGCCISETGFCSMSVPYSLCENGEWKPDQYCMVDECYRGCCILGSNSEFVTEKNCYFKSMALGIDMDFDKNIHSEAECIYATMADDKGACISTGDFDIVECVYTTRGDCSKNKKNKFYKDRYCSDMELAGEYGLDEPICEPQVETGCLDDMRLKRDFNVYWFDGCGNIDGIVKENGIPMECNPIINKMCGEWESFEIDKRNQPVLIKNNKKSYTSDYICKQMSCMVEIEGRDGLVEKKNGESWCEYLGNVGESKDVVGAEHILHRCQNGEEVIESCTDYRREICVQSCSPGECSNDNTDKYTTASCVTNGWTTCYQHNQYISCDDEGNCDYSLMEEKCGDDEYCEIHRMDLEGSDLSKYFKFNMCVPSFPPGFDISDKNNRGETECSFASQTCPVYYEKKYEKGGLKGMHWVCIANCHCEKPAFPQKMNDYCVSLGDCGAYVNYNGDPTENGYYVTTKNGGSYSGDSEKDYSSRHLGSEDGKESIPPFSLEGEEVNVDDPGQYGNKVIGPRDYWGDSAGWLASSLGIGGIAFLVNVALTPLTFSLAAETVATTSAGYSAISGPGALNGITAVGAGIAFAVILTFVFKLQGQAAPSMIAAGAAAGLVMWATGCAAFGPWGLVAAAVLVAIAGLLKWSDLGDVQERVLEFHCLPSQPPKNADASDSDCDICNQQSICTRYMCESLGNDCKFINPTDPENRRCISEPYEEISAPTLRYIPGSARLSSGIPGGIGITNQEEFLEAFYPNDKMELDVDDSDQGIRIYRTDIGGEDDYYPNTETSAECIPENTKIEFTLKTVYRDDPAIDAYAVCKVSNEFPESYDRMGNNFFGGDSFKSINHTMILDILDSADGVVDEMVKKYVLCERGEEQGIVPFEIQLCVAEDDRTAPVITKVYPEDSPFIKFGETEYPIEIYNYEKSDCKWSWNDLTYENMDEANKFDCDYLVFAEFKCDPVTLTGIDTNTDFYIRCKDRSINENTMTESFEYSVIPSESDLAIDLVKPDPGFIKTIGINEPAPVTLRVQTSGGAENGASLCSWVEGQKGYADDFGYDYKSDHTYEFTGLSNRDYAVDISCIDRAGNIAEDSTSFTIFIDGIPPNIVRYYYQEGRLKVVTSEEANCRYDTSAISVFENVTSMLSNDGIEHSIQWEPLKSYYISCEDEYDNMMNNFRINTY